MDYLTEAEKSQLASLVEHDPFARDVHAQLERILGSRSFARVQQRAQDFLSFIVAKSLLGQAATIKETTIAMAVFGEPASFNTAESAKVRVAGTDLRKRVENYRLSASTGDPVEIRVPPHTYVPEFIDRRLTIEIARLQNWGASDEEAHIASAFVEELRYRLTSANIRAAIGPTVRLGSNRRVIVVRGGCAIVQERFQANLSAVEFASGRLLCSKTFDESSDQVLVAARRTADLVLSTLTEPPSPRPATGRASHPHSHP
jgi:hypothetical protein